MNLSILQITLSNGYAIVFDFEISNEDMAAIDAMPYCGGSGLHPDEVAF